MGGLPRSIWASALPASKIPFCGGPSSALAARAGLRRLAASRSDSLREVRIHRARLAGVEVRKLRLFGFVFAAEDQAQHRRRERNSRHHHGFGPGLPDASPKSRPDPPSDDLGWRPCGSGVSSWHWSRWRFLAATIDRTRNWRHRAAPPRRRRPPPAPAPPLPEWIPVDPTRGGDSLAPSAGDPDGGVLVARAAHRQERARPLRSRRRRCSEELESRSTWAEVSCSGAARRSTSPRPSSPISNPSSPSRPARFPELRSWLHA